jgi:hypothetical protein
METSTHALLNDDGIQAPLIPNEETDEDFYRIEPSSHTRKNLSYSNKINVVIFRWYSCSIC